MAKTKIQIKSVFGAVLFEYDGGSMKAAVADAQRKNINLHWSNLRGSDLSRSDLRESDLRGTRLPSPTTVLLANWTGPLSDTLIADLMEYDAASHPNRAMFDAWAAGGPCPYKGVHVQRAALFTENKTLWGKGKLHGAYSLMRRLFEERKIKR